MNTKTYQPKAKDITRNWHLIDAKDKVLGRMATEIARKLMGKHKATYSAHMDSGDYVLVVNAKDVKVTGQKAAQKVYKGHSGYPGGYKEVAFSKMIKERPGRVIEYAVWGMLPDNRLRDKRMRRLKVFAGEEHTYRDKIK